MRWESLVSIQNLRLAWRRINTAKNLQYKRFFRELYLVYEGALDDNLRELHKKLISKVWQPNHAVRIYLPKPSGLQRPISLLGIEDQILLQAIANGLALKLRTKRKIVELKTVFSNKLAEPKDSIFFTEQWQRTYKGFQAKCVEHFNAGYRWSAHFDLSAYYDTISHDLLFRVISPGQSHPETWAIVSDWLQKWSASESAAMTGHGIPQGPIASDFLAEAFFLPIDIYLLKAGYTYIRYVDDIRLFGKTENEVRQIAVILEQQCRHRGLIPQGKKFAIVELKSPEDAMGSLPSIQQTDGKGISEPEMTSTDALSILDAATGGRPITIKDKSHFRYVMYRAPADRKILAKVLKLLPKHPEHIDAFVAYFANFSKRHSITKAILNYLASGLPYSYVRGELWQVLTRMGNRKELESGLSLARIDARKRMDCVVLSWGVMHFLLRCETEGLFRMGKRLKSETPMGCALLVPFFPEKEFTSCGCVKILLKGTLEEQLAAVRELQRRKVSLGALGLRQRDLSPLCRNVLRSLGVIRRRHRIKTDWICEKLTTLYGCRDIPIWRGLLGLEYEHALQFIIEADVRYQGAYSEWLSLQDSFNDIVIRQFFIFLKSKGLSGHSAVFASNGQLVKYGTLIARKSPFDLKYHSIADLLKQIHDRRNSLPGSHPYDEKKGTKNRWLKKMERNVLATMVRKSLDQIAIEVQKNA
ncbi:MAG: RNA-directed DNA polymerase [Anaerolineaceae bacterium]